MTVYHSIKSKFLRDTDNRDIEDIVANAYLSRTVRYVPDAEIPPTPVG